MRIIVTKSGIVEFVDTNVPSGSDYHIPNSNNINLQHRQIIRSISNPNISLSSQKNTTNSSRFYNIPQIKTIRVKQTKLNIPMDKIEQYNKDFSRNTNDNVILPEINISSSALDSASSGLPILRKSFSIKEIMRESCLQKLTDKLRKENFMNSHDINIDHTYLRKENFFNKRINEVEKGADTLINSDNTSLIEYLKNKKTISEKFIANIKSYNDKKMDKINKVCQQILKKKKEDKLDLELQTKILNKKIKMQQEYRSNVFKANSVLNCFYTKISQTSKNRKATREEAFGHIHDQFVSDYWRKQQNFKRFFHKKLLSQSCNGNIGNV